MRSTALPPSLERPRGSETTAATTEARSGAQAPALNQSLLLSHQPDELLSFLIDVLSDNEPSSSDASSLDSSAVNSGAASSAARPITKSKQKQRAPRDPSSLLLTATQRNKHRDRMRKELHKQRALVADLEAEVLAFRQGKIVVSTDDRARLSSAWRRIAETQRTYRNQAEAENTRLKRELQHVIHLTQSIAQILGDKRGQSYSLGPQLKAKKLGLSQFEDVDEFGELAVDVESSFTRVDTVFRENGLDRVTSDLAKLGCIKTNKNYGGRSYLELTSVSIEPFDSRVASDQLWQVLATILALQSGPRTELVWQAEDSFAVKYHPDDCDEQRLPRSKLVMKRFSITSGKAVVVWRAYSQLSGNLVGAMADETGWIKVQPVADSSGFQSSGSIVRTCVHVLPKSSTAVDSESNQHFSMKAFGEVIFRLSDHDRQAMLRMLESMLLGGVISSSG